MTASRKQKLELRGTPCPLNFVRIKLELDRLGELVPLSVIVDSGEIGRDILLSLRSQNFVVTDIIESKDSLRFTVAAASRVDPDPA
jgi:TusA-related sulfurtransferase